MNRALQFRYADVSKDRRSESKTMPGRSTSVAPRNRQFALVQQQRRRPTGQSLVDEAVERLCAQGCRVVYQRIDELRSGAAIEELQGLDDYQRELVAVELESIMAVYAENGSVCMTASDD